MTNFSRPDNAAATDRRRDGSRSAPTVSVIVPAYNAARFIRETLDSVFAQTFRDFEVILVNDGSLDTPELERVLQEYAGRITYLKQENRGPSAARNAAIRVASGRYLALLDADDAWYPEYLEFQLGILEREPQIDVLYANALFFGGGPGSGSTFMDYSPSEGEANFENLLTLRCTVMVSCMFRRDTIFRVGLFDEELLSAEDFDLWLRIAHAGGRIAYHRRVLIRYRRHAGSLSSDPVWMAEHGAKVLEKAARTLKLTPRQRGLVERQKLRFAALRDYFEGKRALRAGEVDVAVERLSRANRILRSRKIALALPLFRLAPALLCRLYMWRERRMAAPQQNDPAVPVIRTVSEMESHAR